MALPVVAPFATQKMDGGRNRDGYGFGGYAVGDANWGIVFHTTETAGVPSYLRTGSDGKTYSVAPHFTYLPSKRQWIQHNRLDVRSGTLSGASTLENGEKVPTNAAKVIQVEIACYSSKSIADKYGRLWVYNLTEENLVDLAEFVEWCHVNFAVPLVWYPKKSVTRSIPMTHGAWWHKRTWGITDHSASPDESTHWDCGAIRSSEIMRLLGENMAVTRIGGADRYDTAARVSQDVFPEGSELVAVASGLSDADALSAGMYGVPVLLTDPNKLPAATAKEIVRLGAKDVIIVGGTAAVSKAVEDELRALIA